MGASASADMSPSADRQCRLVRAISIANNIREEHNGVFEVMISLGHDGNNVCVLRGYDKDVGRGESGTDLLDAVEKALGDWRKRKFRKEADIVSLANEAILLRTPNIHRVFSTADFQRVCPVPLTPEDVDGMLIDQARIVRLATGAYWMLLPEGYHRYIAPKEKGN
jgi:hypothetical protein